MSFSITPTDSFINYLPMQFTHNSNEYFLYDKYSSSFIIINSNNQSYSILQKKDKINVPFSNLSIQPITDITIDESFLYLIEVHSHNVVLFRSIKRNISSIIFQSEKDKILSVLFISSNENKKKIAIITSTSLSIYTAEVTHEDISREIIFAKGINIDDFAYSKSKKILIIKSGVTFIMLNMNNIEVTRVSFQVGSLLSISKFFIEDIYYKSYFVHFTEGEVQLMNLNSVNKIEKLLLYSNELNERQIDYKSSLIQFFNNLVVIYINKNILIYDIKQKNNYNIGVIELESSFNWQNAKIYGQMIEIDNQVYKAKFNLDYFYKNSNCNTYDTFFTLLRRAHSNKICVDLLIDLISKFQVTNLKNIFTKLIRIIVKNNSKRQNESNYIPQEKLYAIFLDRRTTHVSSEKKIKLLIFLLHILKENNVHIDETFFIVLENIVDSLDSFEILDSIIKNGIPPNEKFASFLIDKSTEREVNSKQGKRIFNLGIHILSQLNLIDEIVLQLIQNKLYIESVYALYLSFIDNKRQMKIKKNYNEVTVINYILNNIKKIVNNDIIVD